MATGAVVLVQLLITAVTASLALFAWRYRARPGGRPFAALAGAIAVLSATYLALLVDIQRPALVEAAVLLRDGVLTVIPVLWVAFALDYTGYGRYLTKRAATAIAAVPLATLAVLATPSLRGAYWGPRTDTLTAGLVELGPPFGPWYWVNLGYGYLLMTSGLLLLFGLVVSQNRLYTDQSVAVAVGGVVPFVANMLVQADVTLVPLPLQPLSFAVTGLAFAFALYRSELFAALPVTRQVGRHAVVEDVQEGVLIADASGRVVDVNQAGAALFDAAPSALVGQPVDAVLGDQSPDGDEVAPSVYRSADSRSYDVTVSQIRDRSDRPVGRALVFRDITDRELRESQLEVLNRVLRHNLRNKLNVVHGHAEVLSAQVPEALDENVQRQLAATEALLALGERAREFEAVKTREAATPRPTDAAALLEALVSDLAAEFPEATVTAEGPPLTLATYPEVLEVVLENLLRNGLEHADRTPRVEATVAATDRGVEFAVRDNGPGIPASELEVLDAGTETALEHGSGLGLWIATWGVRYLGGTLTFEAREPRGTTAVVALPESAPVERADSDAPPAT